MSVESEVLTIATGACKGLGWTSEMFGYVGTRYFDDGEVYCCKDEDEYVSEILNYADNLNDHFNSVSFNSQQMKSAARDFVDRSKSCDLVELEKLARADWQEIVEEHSA